MRCLDVDASLHQPARLEACRWNVPSEDGANTGQQMKTILAKQQEPGGPYVEFENTISPVL